MTDLALKHGLQFSDLYERDGLIRVDRAFVAHLAAADAELHNRLMAGRADPAVLAWELRYAAAVGRWLEDEAAHQLPIKAALQYAAWATLSPEGQARHRRGLLFKVPHRLDMHHLVLVEAIEREGVAMLRRPESD